jgi:type I restriction-modification system DNA methylase subunit
MTNKLIRKHSGATFTPEGLADFLSERILKYLEIPILRILDPACGEGELLVSIGKKLNERRVDFSLTGIDSNDNYLNIARQRIRSQTSKNPEIISGDFLESFHLVSDQLSFDLFTTPTLQNLEVNVVIANPPYVRTQILGTEKAQLLAKKFNLKGRVDLYYPFLIGMTTCLQEGGILGVLTSNRYLSTKSGESIRKYLSENYEILEIIDLGDTKLFDAAVLPAIFIGRKRKKTNPSPIFMKIYEESNVTSQNAIQANSVFEILNSDKSGCFQLENKSYHKTEGVLVTSNSKGHPWSLLSKEESGWISQIDRSTKFRVGDFFKVRVGIKTTADKIFIREDWNDLGKLKPEETLLKDLISQENIQKWNFSQNSNLKVLYPYTTVNGKKEVLDIDNFPKTKSYFLDHEKDLKKRKYVIEAGRKWYEIWVSHNPDLWRLPKLVFPDISDNPRFCFDLSGKIVNGNCYWIVGSKDSDIDILLLIQGVANSKLMIKYHDSVFNNKLYSGRRRYFTQYVEKYPVPNIDLPVSKEIIQIVKELNDSSSPERILKLENELELKVAEAFGINPILL